MAFSIIFVHFYGIEADIYESRASASGGLNYSRSRARERDIDILLRSPRSRRKEGWIERKIIDISLFIFVQAFPDATPLYHRVREAGRVSLVMNYLYMFLYHSNE